MNHEEGSMRTNLPYSIIVRRELDFIGFRNEIIKLVGSKNIFRKSSTNFLKTLTNKSDHFQALSTSKRR